ncbi:hypothetical protein ACFL5H_02910 [Candidatus Latescibacterota bacterium]
MKHTLVSYFLVAVLFCVCAGEASGAGRTIAVLPFYDDSGYNGPWELYRDVPEMLGDMLYDDYFMVVPMDTVLSSMPQEKEPGIFMKFINLFRNTHHRAKILSDLEAVTIARQLNADYVVTGIIESFSYRRRGGGGVNVGGYKSYVATVDLSNVRVIRVVDATPVGTVQGDSEQNDRGWGLELLGKPRDRDLEFLALDSMDFGSKDFLGTLMGIATIEALNMVHKEIRAIVAAPDENYYATKQFKIISVDNGVVNIDAGSVDGIRPGDRFRVFTADSGILVGRINVTQLWADHISKAEIVDGRDEIRTGDVIMPEE